MNTGGNVNDLTTRFIKAAQEHGGNLGKEAIRALMAEAWEEGANAGWAQSGEGFNAEYPDECADKWSVSLKENPYINDCATCDHPASHHDAGECWTGPGGEQVQRNSACACGWYEPKRAA